MLNIKNKVNSYMLMALLGNAIFGFSFLFSKVALSLADPFILLALRFDVAFIFMALLKYLHIVKCDLKGKNVQSLYILGLLQPVLYFICESYGIQMTSSSFAGIIISLIPIVGLILGSIILNEKPPILQIIFSFISVLGVIIMTLVDNVSGFQFIGFIVLLGAVFTGAMFNVQSRQISTEFTAFERTYVMFKVGACIFTLIAICKVREMNLWFIPLSHFEFWMSIIYLSCVSSIGAFMLLNKALDVLDVTRTLVFANVTTVISVLAGVFILHENFSLIQFFGIILVLIGVYGVNRFVRE